jgi:hypothetical protein
MEQTVVVSPSSIAWIPAGTVYNSTGLRLEVTWRNQHAHIEIAVSRARDEDAEPDG